MTLEHIVGFMPNVCPIAPARAADDLLGPATGDKRGARLGGRQTSSGIKAGAWIRLAARRCSYTSPTESRSFGATVRSTGGWTARRCARLATCRAQPPRGQQTSRGMKAGPRIGPALTGCAHPRTRKSRDVRQISDGIRRPVTRRASQLARTRCDPRVVIVLLSCRRGAFAIATASRELSRAYEGDAASNLMASIGSASGAHIAAGCASRCNTRRSCTKAALPSRAGTHSEIAW
jgi:hypothetical protein